MKCSWLVVLVIVLLILAACVMPAPGSPAENQAEETFAEARKRMVAEDIVRRGINHPRVLEAMEKVPWHRFVPEEYLSEAYADHPLPIGHGQTISQPYIVALMTQHLLLEPGDKVLEIGTGSGYQAAIKPFVGARIPSDGDISFDFNLHSDFEAVAAAGDYVKLTNDEINEILAGV